MPGPRYFDPFETPRSADGRFAEKEGSAPEVAVEAGISYADAVARAEEILREDVYDDGQGFSTREVFIDVDVLRALLPTASFIHTSAPGSEQRVFTGLVLDDPEVQAAHREAREHPELFTSADDLP